AWGQHINIGQAAHDGNIFGSLVGGAIRTSNNTCVVAGNFDVSAVVNSGGADGFPVFTGIKGGVRGDEDALAGNAKSGSHSGHVLFGYTNFDKAVGELFGEGFAAGRFG